MNLMFQKKITFNAEINTASAQILFRMLVLKLRSQDPCYPAHVIHLLPNNNIMKAVEFDL